MVELIYDGHTDLVRMTNILIFNGWELYKCTGTKQRSHDGVTLYYLLVPYREILLIRPNKWGYEDRRFNLISKVQVKQRQKEQKNGIIELKKEKTRKNGVFGMIMFNTNIYNQTYVMSTLVFTLKVSCTNNIFGFMDIWL